MRSGSGSCNCVSVYNTKKHTKETTLSGVKGKKKNQVSLVVDVCACSFRVPAYRRYEHAALNAAFAFCCQDRQQLRGKGKCVWRLRVQSSPSSPPCRYCGETVWEKLYAVAYPDPIPFAISFIRWRILDLILGSNAPASTSLSLSFLHSILLFLSFSFCAQRFFFDRLMTVL